uniref:uL9m n=1 Tax=Polytomella magna TaxID=353565 RepID=UPI002240E4FE|nr:Chain Af, uL9m [Polytomella magna]8APN_Af Chain Af, uL9m [Polytomella magna]8APO_Af Chain Af, uL9m [Polytomella magna]
VEESNGKLVKIVLLDDVDRVGQQGQTVVVKAGLMRHLLFPEGKALYATPENEAKYS